MQPPIASSQYRIQAGDLETVLALMRAGTLAGAAEQLGQNTSTVFRNLQKLERGLGSALFVRSRTGYEPTETAARLAEQAERVEAALDASRAVVRQQPGALSGTVRLTTTDTILHGLVAPALLALREAHPLLEFELQAGNQLANLSRRDADIAVRATKRPPAHLVGRPLGTIEVALFAAVAMDVDSLDAAVARGLPWVAPDDALPEHPSVLWRRRLFPRLTPQLRADSILTVAHLVRLGLGVGVLPLFLARDLPGLRRISDPIEEARSELWLLTHPESRHLRRVSTVYNHLAEHCRP